MSSAKFHTLPQRARLDNCPVITREIVMLRSKLVIVMALGVAAWAQSDDAHSRGPAGEVGSGVGDVGKGAGKGAGHAAEGAAKGAGDVVTLHPVKGAANVGKGAGEAGKDVTVGTAKGTGKVVKGIGKAFKKIF